MESNSFYHGIDYHGIDPTKAHVESLNGGSDNDTSGPRLLVPLSETGAPYVSTVSSGYALVLSEPRPMDEIIADLNAPGLALAAKAAHVDATLALHGKDEKNPKDSRKRTYYAIAKNALPAMVGSVLAPEGTPRAGLPYHFHSGLYVGDLDCIPSGMPADEKAALLEEALALLDKHSPVVGYGHSASADAWVMLAGPGAEDALAHRHYLAAILNGMPEIARQICTMSGQNNLDRLRYLYPDAAARYRPGWIRAELQPPSGRAATPRRSRREDESASERQAKMQTMMEKNKVAPPPLTAEGMAMKKAEVRDALAAVPLEDGTGHPDWIRAGYALCAADTNWPGFGGRGLFVEWTRTNAYSGSTKPDRADDQYSELERTRDMTLTIGPLFDLARAHGWNRITVETTPEPEQQPRKPSGPTTDQKKGSGKKSNSRTRAKKGESGKDALVLVDALQKLGLKIRFNSRSLKSEVQPITAEGSAIVTAWGKAAKTQPNQWTILQPAQAANLRARIARASKYLAGNGQEYRLRFSKEEWREANLDLSATNYADPFEEWMEGNPAWDSLDRWALIFIEGFGVIPGEHHTIEYLAHAGKLLILPCVGRLYEPGAEASTITVLIGKEGIGKSLGLKCLFPEEWRLRWFSDSINLRVSDQQLLEKVAGFVLLEIGELSGMMRTEQERVKTLISSCQDVARLAYREDSEAFPRMFNWCGSANDEGHGVLPDSSENRRYWPVNIPASCNRHRVLKWFRDNHQQLWAQALAEWQAKGIEAWLTPEDLEPERMDSAAAQRREADGSPDLVDAIETLDPEMLAKGHTLAELLRAVGAFGQGPSEDGSASLDLAEVAAKIASGPGAGVAQAVTTVLKRRGWKKTPGNPNRGRAARGQSFWWPPADGPSQNVRGSEVSDGASGRAQCETGGMNTGGEADNVEAPPHTTPSYTPPCQPLTPSDTETKGDLPYHGPEPDICSRHAKPRVGDGCPDCYREWTVAEEEETQLRDAGTV